MKKERNNLRAKKENNKVHVNEKYLTRKFILLFPHVFKKETREFP
jgi:hypothetical protein